MAAKKDLYEILGVSKDVSVDELRTAYRKLARKYHPDVNPGDSAAEERFKEISAAYETLGDEKKRALYDEFGDAGLRDGFDPDKARMYRQWGGARPDGHGQAYAYAGETSSPFGPGFEFDLRDIFGDFFARGGSFTQREARQARGQDLMVTVEVDMAQALRGAELHLRVPTARGEEPLTVRVPKGADNGSVLRVRGKGAPGVGGGPPGDLVIETRVEPHPYFRREGLDLHLRLPVTLDEAYNGASVPVPTPDGEVRLTVPPRSQQGTKLRLRGKGVERGSRRGDLYVELDVRLPDEPNEALAQAAKEAANSYQRPVRQGVHL